MSYIDTFIVIAPDSKASEGIIPVPKRAGKPIHVIQYELLTEKPYHYTHEELVFAVHVQREGITEAELEAQGDEIRAEFFKKGHPCMRASALTKQYGWGAHYNDEGKIAIYPMDSAEYQRFAETCPNILPAMKSKR